MLINVDNDGTFSDICVVNGKQVSYTKTITTPFDLSQCLFAGLASLLQSTQYIRYSIVQERTPSSSARARGLGCWSPTPNCRPIRLRRSARRFRRLVRPAGCRTDGVHPGARESAPSKPIRCALDAVAERSLLSVAGSLAECCETLPQFAPLLGGS